MSTSVLAKPPAAAQGFVHEALLHAGDEGFVEALTPFLRNARLAGEAVFVAVPGPKIDLLRDHVEGELGNVRFADMHELGANPARIIPAWQDFVVEQSSAGRRFRGVGEPVWPGRSAAEVAECERHEALLNLAFAESPPWWLLCPYDTDRLPDDVVEAVRRTHPTIVWEGVRQRSGEYARVDPQVVIAGRLPEPRVPVAELEFGAGPLRAVRQLVAGHAAGAGLSASRTDAFVLAADELAANSIRHGGGGGRVRVWREPEALVCEVADAGSIDDPLVGRQRPELSGRRGRGLWLVNQLCDLVELRSSDAGTVVRVRMRSA